MKALILENYHTPYVLKEIERPSAAFGEVLVRVVASGVNPLDIKIKNGQAAHAETKLPAILGIDMSGVVEAVGEGVTAFKTGDEVYGMVGGIAGIPGTLAEYVAADAGLLALKPANLSHHEAAALPLVLVTAWEGMVDRANIGAGKKVLVQGGAGGVGHIAVQLGKAMGAEVFATAAPADFELIRSYGAIPVDYHLNAEEYNLEYTGGEGFDLIFDTVGGEVLDASFRLAKRYTGHLVSILGWGTHSLAPLSFRGATYSGVFTLYPLISGKGRAHQGEILKKATTLIEAEQIRPLLSEHVYTLKTIEEAYQAVASGDAHGKVVISI